MKEQHSNLVFIFTAWTGMVLMSALQAEAPEANPRGLRQGPVVQEITPIGTPTKDRNPKYTFHSDQAGTTLYGGSCTSSTVYDTPGNHKSSSTIAEAGNNTITFNLSTGETYSDCSITVTNLAGNSGELSILKITPFTIEPKIEFISHSITDDADGAHDIFPVDLDRDGDLDVVSAEWSDHEVMWYENDGQGNFSANTIASPIRHASSVEVVDLDGDGDLDALSDAPFDDTVYWHENDGFQNSKRLP